MALIYRQTFALPRYARQVPGRPVATAALIRGVGVPEKPVLDGDGIPSIQTVRQRIAILSVQHQQFSDQDNPCRSPAVQLALRNSRRAPQVQRGRGKSDALTNKLLQMLLATCDDTLAGLRDRALLYFAASSGGRRRSELGDVTIERLKQGADAKGRVTYTYQMGRSKTNQTGEHRHDSFKPVEGDAAEALAKWIARGQIKFGPVFTRLSRHDCVMRNSVTRAGIPLSGDSVNTIVKRRRDLAVERLADDLGASHPEVAALRQLNITSHSLRAGFVTEACKNGSAGQGMSMSGHKSPHVYASYDRSTPDFGSPVTGLFNRNE